MKEHLAPGFLERAQGCLLGQLAGDALGGLVEFQRPEDIQRSYPHGVRELADGSIWGTLAGQPTDDSETALSLARLLAAQRRYDPAAALAAYQAWLASGPFDCGTTIRQGLRGQPNPDSQANGALMRISPLGIFGANYPLVQVAAWARQDAALTHPHPVCQEANALWQLRHAANLEEGVVDTVSRGGDTDTNAAICGALLGAVFGREAIPVQWREALRHCRPAAGDPRVRRPRPECYWPVDTPELAAALLTPPENQGHDR
ncbi:MAG: ADP-ribosylglycohydrolase family protein [Desulfobacca sp.]|uniref:ADP-ribosylglycohydrolase family protein n=1 Tax=Desulfobacca sp. TaxID=2067990 RepID=UPI00404B5CAF